MTRFDDGIPDLTPCTWAVRTHRRAYAVAKQWRKPSKGNCGSNPLPIRCRHLELVWPSLTDVAAWFDRRGIGASVDALRAAIYKAETYHGYRFEFVRNK